MAGEVGTKDTIVERCTSVGGKGAARVGNHATPRLPGGMWHQSTRGINASAVRMEPLPRRRSLSETTMRTTFTLSSKTRRTYRWFPAMWCDGQQDTWAVRTGIGGHGRKGDKAGFVLAIDNNPRRGRDWSCGGRVPTIATRVLADPSAAARCVTSRQR